MKILWHSNAPWCPSGYGNQTSLFTQRLQADGNEVAISAYYGFNGASIDWQGIKILPGGWEQYGNDVVNGHAEHWFEGEEGLVFALCDAWVLNSGVWKDLPSVWWSPIDHGKVPPRVLKSIVESGCVSLAMTKHAEGAMRNAGLDPIYVPHGIDTKFYRPMDGRDEGRERLDWPQDAFVIGMVSTNTGYPSRKGYPQALLAFSEFVRKHNDAILYMHTEPHGVIDGVKLPVLIQELEIPPDNIRYFSPYQYVSGTGPNHLLLAYNCMDVLLCPSLGEGFGIPIVEAQACGTPVIVTDWTSMSELAGAGWLVGGDLFWNAHQDAFWKMPAISEIVDALEGAYRMSSRMGQAARDFAVQYDADLVYEKYMAPALAQAHERIYSEIEVPAE